MILNSGFTETVRARGNNNIIDGWKTLEPLSLRHTISLSLLSSPVPVRILLNFRRKHRDRGNICACPPPVVCLHREVVFATRVTPSPRRRRSRARVRLSLCTRKGWGGPIEILRKMSGRRAPPVSTNVSKTFNKTLSLYIIDIIASSILRKQPFDGVKFPKNARQSRRGTGSRWTRSRRVIYSDTAVYAVAQRPIRGTTKEENRHHPFWLKFHVFCTKKKNVIRINLLMSLNRKKKKKSCSISCRRGTRFSPFYAHNII